MQKPKSDGGRGGKKASGEPKPRLTQKLAEILEMPENTLGNVVTAEICSNTEAVFDGCDGVLEYTSDTVRIAAGRMVIKINGRNLRLRSMSTRSVVVSGFIFGLEYLV